ncbi:hypothetical protein FHR95_000238 [Halomonas fontilapidosi]|uniref:Prepilin peptidase n=1 Tax=Halomonas fontilapidosi TaxID=616675 RepID=A0A7W5DGX7_9GAMM|nr:SEC-C metal-binding domain-containing protein [Halomonas fontilapidosi]MBB3182714.1 hypothetical protein [Halomonas fontilapidosi]
MKNFIHRETAMPFGAHTTGRSEQEVFNELQQLCSSSGYIYAICHIAIRDSFFAHDSKILSEQLSQRDPQNNLIRTEISTLIGLAIKTDLNLTPPGQGLTKHYVEESERLLKELHQTLSYAFFESLSTDGNKTNPFTKAEVMREPIFYGPESAYIFQYRELAPLKYSNDNGWLVSNKGFSINEAKSVIDGVIQIQNHKVSEAKAKDKYTELDSLNALCVNTHEISALVDLPLSRVENVLECFSTTEKENNNNFNSLNDFNIYNAKPAIKISDDNYLIPQQYSLAEALYESPFFWMAEDSSYCGKASKNRGEFTEKFCSDRLKRVFGSNSVKENIDLFKGNKKVGEIDVLATFGDRAIIVQAKSKRLTIESRKGNDGQLREDFKKSIQGAYDQGLICATQIQDPDTKLKDSTGREIKAQKHYKEIYILCLVSDHYPALTFQSRNFLNYQTTNNILPPIASDIFLLDTLTEFLNTPLYFLSYLNRRTYYSEKFLATHEITILAAHIKRNLWIDEGVNLVSFDDSVSFDLDIAMAVRRDGLPGKPTPEGILTRLRDTYIGKIIKQIEDSRSPSTLDFGFLLLQLSESTVTQLSRNLIVLLEKSRRDHKPHDLTMLFNDGNDGLTIHVTQKNPTESTGKLKDHCVSRKYIHRAKRWYGICIDPASQEVKYGITLDFPWEHNPDLEDLTSDMSEAIPINQAYQKIKKIKKTGRNEPCPCGSGKKYKKCCLK